MTENSREISGYGQSSRTFQYSNQASRTESALKSSQKNEIIPKIQIKTVDNINNINNNTNNYLSVYPKNKNLIKSSLFSLSPEKELQNRRVKNTFISLHNPLKAPGKKLLNYMHLQTKKPRMGHGNKFIDTQYFLERRNSHQMDFPMEKPKKNLKQIQRELQYKLLDMSIQIENDSDNDKEEDYIDQELNFKRKEKKRFTEYPRSNVRHTSLKQLLLEKKLSNDKIKSAIKGDNNNNSNKLLQNNNNINNNIKSNINNNDNSVNNNVNMRGRRQSFMPKNLLLANKFEKNIPVNKNKLNLTVNMNLYRDLIPNIKMTATENELFNVNNKSMLVSKKKINIKKILLYSIKNEEFENKYRLLTRQKELYDSYEDEEVIEELEDEFFFISPETYRIFIFDTLLLLSTIFFCLYVPIYIAQSKCFCSYMPQAIEYILLFYEFLNIVDIIICFFRAYYNFEFALEKKNSKIILHYLKKYFFLDLLSAIPFFTIAYYFCNFYKIKPDSDICFYNGVDLKYNFIKMFLGLKMIKLIKVLDKKSNRGINYFYEVISENYTLEKTMKMLLFTLMIIIGFNFFICYHIYIGLQSYPNWVLKTNNQDSSFVTLYITSLYFLVATITSVGYGDITCISISETCYQIIILTIGVIAYSWIVSTIGNYVKKETRAAIKFNKDLSLLEEIRVSYPKMSFKLYNKIHKHLETVSHQQEKLDTNLLVTNLPYTLKNQIMFIIYGSVIKKFKFFKDCENSDFILRVLTSFIPLSTKKGAFIIQEGEIIDNIVFVREGRLSLVATIDLDNPLLSIENYLGEKFEDINEKMSTKLDNSLMEGSVNMGLKKEKATTVLKSFLKTKEDIEEENIEQEMAKKDFNGEDIEIGNLQFLNILDILKNEHYGIVYMLLKKPSPLSLRVKSKYCQLFLLRKNDTKQISKAYPNVWKKIYFKSYHNMKSIKHITKKIIINYCKNYGLKHASENNEESDISKHETDFLFKLGILNSRKRNNVIKKTKFNLEGNNSSNKNLTKPKSILKHKFGNTRNDNLLKLSNKSLIGCKSFKPENHFFNNKLSALNNSISPRKQSNTNVGRGNISFFSSRNRLSSLSNDEPVGKTKINQINQINNNINYNIVINDVDINNDSKTLLKSEENKGSSFMKKSFKKLGSINTYERSSLKKSNFMQNVPITIKGMSKLTDSKNNLHLIPPENQSLNKIVTLNVPNNKEENILKTKTIEMNNTDENKLENSPNTINDLSKSLLKKVKKKIKKRRKKKKLYKMLFRKIAESIAKVNPGINLNSSLNHNTNSIILSSKIGEMISLNPESNNIIDEKPELNNSNLPQNYNQDNSNSNLNPDMNQNFLPYSTPQEFFQFQNPNELFLIPELSSSESSSENSDESNSSEKNEASSKNNSKNDLNENSTKKKEWELSISENNNFTLNMTYDNINKLSEGNYSKDENLRKSVFRLIKVYLSEKSKNEKTEKIENERKNKTSVLERSSIIKATKLNDNLKEKVKEEKKEKDVWSFLDTESKKEDSGFNFESQKNENSLEKVQCKSPQARRKKTNNITKKKPTRKIYDDLFNLDEPTPKNKKTFHKKKTRKIINKTTVKKDVQRKKSRKKMTNNLIKSNLQPLEKDKENNKDKEKDKDKESNIISSLEFSELDEGTNPKETYKKKNYKTYQNKGKKDNKNENENSNDKKSKDSKDSDNFG